MYDKREKDYQLEKQLVDDELKKLIKENGILKTNVETLEAKTTKMSDMLARIHFLL